ncbi:acetylxylan esterase [Ruminiclostridium cellobioparum]|uniref:Acetyl esterase (Deacetylase) n=1 Tax=Ruminiclostridium cellobioparum subsp. termitidis CT1112 TaxID=1195236 RepID=S0FLY5_RUMCE|nr:acetylxylan esterase [Ruminiclostridium cellobioparum]EMS70179.1 Acetyl esterase (deacetylase) [Ruminiclostridium cellobioparum subsp. termitidis CT1112]
MNPSHGDMPLEELEKYTGSTPCPADFDIFWDKALEEMSAAAPEVELIPSDFVKVPFAECFDLYFTGVGGARIHAKYLRPKASPKPCPAVLKFHGYAWHSGDWHDKLNYVAMGFCVAALDCRGQGGTSEDTGCIKGPTLRGHIIRGINDSPEKMLFRQIYLDTAQLANIVMSFPEVDESYVCTTGESQGGALALVCAALEPRIAKAAPVHPYLSDFKRYWYLDAQDEIKEYFRFFDPMHLREKEIFNKLGYIDIQNLVKRIKAEVLFSTGLLDQVCPPSTQFAAYNKISAAKQMLLFHDYAHEYYPQLNDYIFKFICNI